MQISKWIIVLCCLFFSCQPGKKSDKKVDSPPGYDFANPQKINLPEELDEISGIVYDSASGNLITVNDEEGILYKFRIDSINKLTDSRFHKGADFEELISVGPYWYALKSNGNLFKISNGFTDSVSSATFYFRHKGKHEFEAMLYDAVNDRIIVFCKICGKETSASPETFIFDLKKEQFDSLPGAEVLLTNEQQNELNNKDKLQISGAAIHPVTGNWWLLASVSGLIVVTDHTLKVKEIYTLNKKKFKQPEGICFAPNGDLYISNEARTGIANILLFKYNSGNIE